MPRWNRWNHFFFGARFLFFRAVARFVFFFALAFFFFFGLRFFAPGTTSTSVVPFLLNRIPLIRPPFATLYIRPFTRGFLAVRLFIIYAFTRSTIMLIPRELTFSINIGPFSSSARRLAIFLALLRVLMLM